MMDKNEFKVMHEEEDFKVVVWGKGSEMNVGKIVAKLLPTEIHIKPDGAKDDKVSYCCVLESHDMKFAAEISNNMLMRGMKKAMKFLESEN